MPAEASLRWQFQGSSLAAGIFPDSPDAKTSIQERAWTSTDPRVSPRAVPDFVWTVEDLFVVDDRVAARLQDTGTPKQKFLGQDPTGASIKFIEFGSYKVRDGRFAEMWFLMDSAAVREQLLG